MSHDANIAAVAALIAEPARAIMLTALLDGRALPAGELAYASGVTPQTASGHLAKLVDGGLLVLESQGRHRYFRLAGAHIAQALEQLAAIRPAGPARRKALSPEARALRFARCCYDHLAGRLGVAVADGLVGRGFLLPAPDKLFEVTPAGSLWLAGLGIEMAGVKASRRGLARQCLDWTERTHHLAGPLGVRLMGFFCEEGWLRRAAGSRAVEITPKGTAALKRHLGVDAHALCKAG